MERLVNCMSEDSLLSKIPEKTIYLCMLLRFKANFPQKYEKLLEDTSIEESKLIRLTELALTGFPRLFEWSIAWSEIFYVHSIS
jgi:hypothetical protein